MSLLCIMPQSTSSILPLLPHNGRSARESRKGILHRANNHAAEPDSGSEGDEDGTLQPASSAKSNSVTSGSPTRRCTAGSYDLRRHV